MVIYITTNLINGKKYIGKDEVNNPLYLGSGIQLQKAFKKYGKENFEKEILAYGKDKIDLEELEIYYIDYYGAQKSNLFYNIAPGGTGGKVAKNYIYRQKPIFEIDKNGKILKEYKSSKEASLKNNLNYKCLNAVCNNQKRSINNRFFIFIEDINKIVIDKDESFYTKKIFLSLNTGIFYNRKIKIWDSEYSNITYDAFCNKYHRKNYINNIISI